MKKLNTKSLILCSLFSALIAAGAFIKIPIPFVPFTMQFMFTNLAGLLLGKRLGTTSVLVYIFIGLMGIPVFTMGGGLGYLLQPTFGYIIGMAIGTAVTGRLTEGKDSMKTLVAAGFLNILIVYSFGMLYFYIIRKVYMENPISLFNLLIYCGLVFIPGDSLSAVLGAYITKRLGPYLYKQTGLQP